MARSATGASSIAKTSSGVSVATSDTLVLASNPARQEVTITNDGANVVYLKLATAEGAGPEPTPTTPAAVANVGVRLTAAGGSWSSRAYTGPIQGIALTGACVVCVTEI